MMELECSNLSVGDLVQVVKINSRDDFKYGIVVEIGPMIRRDGRLCTQVTLKPLGFDFEGPIGGRSYTTPDKNGHIKMNYRKLKFIAKRENLIRENYIPFYEKESDLYDIYKTI